jgi:hypothetical protein
MLVRVLLLLLGLFHLANGLMMLLAPMNWFQSVPGVAATGPFNHHFILDVGMAFIASGAMLMLGARAGKFAAAFAVAGATWPGLHALIHVADWLSAGFPTDPKTMISEAVGVVAVGVVGACLAGVRTKGEKP